MKLVVVGTGYVGLVAGACLAHAGHEVACVENNKNKLDLLTHGVVPFYEPGLATLVQDYYASGRLRFSKSLAEVLPSAQVVFIAVGTPEGENGQADLRYVYGVAEELGKLARHPFVVVNKSTVPVGTQEEVAKIIRKQLKARNVKLNIEVASNPEFLRQGAAVEDFLCPDRVIIGTDAQEVFNFMAQVYEPVVPRNKILWMDPKSAEMTKYAANAFLATKISFINEISNICDAIGANIEMVSKGIGLDRRISPHFLNAGTGYGGSCFPKDVKALIYKAGQFNYSPAILKAVDTLNQKQKVVLVDKFLQRLRSEGRNPKGLQVALWGLSFKPETDDMREAPSISVVGELLKLGCNVVAYDPQAMERARTIFGNRIVYAESALAALTDSSALFILTEWQEFTDILPEEIAAGLKLPLVLDGRNLYEPKDMALWGIDYLSIGRPSVPVRDQAAVNISVAGK